MTTDLRLKKFILSVLAGGIVLAATPGCGVTVAADVMSRVVEAGADRPVVGVIELSGGGVGGLSGLWVAPDAERFIAVADDGKLVTGRFAHDSAGRLRGVAAVRVEPLLPPGLDAAGKTENDAEEIAAAPGGGWLVAFERHDRILRYGPNFLADGSPQPIPAPPGLESAADNAGIEALAAWSDGALLALEEGLTSNGKARGWFAPVFPQRRSDWREFTYRPAQGFRPSGAAALPNGDALVLERRATWLSGFSARLVHLPRADMATAREAQGRELARISPPMAVDNFEGVAVIADKKDAFDVYVVSDDNYSPLQRTLIMRLKLPVSAVYGEHNGVVR